MLTLLNTSGEWVSVYPDIIRRAILKASPEISSYVLTQQDQDIPECYLSCNLDRSQQQLLHQSVEQHLQESLVRLNIEGIQIRMIIRQAAS